jgi:glycosyltransferase involved in cell wall biosynthesis
MKVMQTMLRLADGGAERVMVDVVRGVIDRGDEAVVAAAPGPGLAMLRQASVPWHPLRPGEREGRRRLRPLATASFGLARAIVQEGADVVHAHNPKAVAVSWAARGLTLRRRHVPLLATFHSAQDGEYRASAMILKRATLVTCVSDSIAERLIQCGVPGERLRVVRNGISPAVALLPEERRSLDVRYRLDGEYVVSIVGRLAVQKGHGRFIEAAARVRHDLPNVRFLIVGDGPLRDEIERQVRAAGLDSLTRMTGRVNDARPLIARSDLVVFSSEFEGSPLVALESLAAGVPVVGIEGIGLSELLDSGAGVVVPPDADALARAITGALVSPEHRTAMGEIGRRLVERDYSLDKMVSEYCQIYAALST